MSSERQIRVLIADQVDNSCQEILEKNGICVTSKYKMAADELIEQIPDFDGLIVRSETSVTSEILKHAKLMKVVARAGAGVDNIDVISATNLGILVLNAPGGNSISAAELTCASILNLARKVCLANESMKKELWERKKFLGSEINGKTLGILGLGRVGIEVCKRMKSFGMHVIVYDPYVTVDQLHDLNVEKVTLERFWKNADYISVHTPLLPETKNLINSKTLGVCKKGVFIINIARGGIINEEDLLNSLSSGHCAGAALDVFVEEPPKSVTTTNLIKHPNVIATPHIGASTEEAQKRVAREIAEQLISFFEKKKICKITGAVNRIEKL